MPVAMMSGGGTCRQ